MDYHRQCSLLNVPVHISTKYGVHKSVVRSVVKKIVYNDRIIAIKLQAEPINILMMQVYVHANIGA